MDTRKAKQLRTIVVQLANNGKIGMPEGKAFLDLIDEYVELKDEAIRPRVPSESETSNGRTKRRPKNRNGD